MSIQHSRSPSKVSLKKDSINESIQQQIEFFMIQLENEKRQGNALDAKILALEKDAKLPFIQSTLLKSTISKLEKDLVLESASLNKISLENELLRQKVDSIRKEKMIAKEKFGKFKLEINKNKNKSKKVHSLSRDYSDLNIKSESRLKKMRGKSDDIRVNFEKKASELSIHINTSKTRRKDFISMLELRLEENDYMRIDPVQTLNILKMNSSAWKKVTSI